jgi:hypothetical protein
MSTATPSTITISELTGAKRVIALTGGGLPKQGAAWGGTQRVITTWYPGNGTEATQHVLGPTEKPTEWNGIWRTNILYRTPATFSDPEVGITQIVDAFTLKEVMESIFRGGALLSVIWGTVVKHGPDVDAEPKVITREGRATDWEFTYDRPDDITWRVSFDWSSRGRRQQKVVAFRTDSTDANMRAMQIASNDVVTTRERNQMISKKRKLLKSANTFSLGQLENLTQAPSQFYASFTRKAQQIADRVKQLGTIVNKTRAIPEQLKNQTLDQANNAVSISNDFLDTISRAPPETLVRKQKVSQLTRAVTFYQDGHATAVSLRRTALVLRTQVDSTRQTSTILAVHVARQRESLFDVSRKFYDGSGGNAAAIAHSNRLPLNTTFVQPGAVLIIPTTDAIKTFNLSG